MNHPATQLPATWLDVVAGHAARIGQRTAYRFLEGGEAETAAMTFAEVDQAARAIAQRLIERGATGQRVILAHPPGLEFVAAFFGCLYAGAVAVPTFPARHGASGVRFVNRLHAILEDAKPVLIATTAETAGRVAEVLPSGCGVKVIATDDIDLNMAEAWERPAITPQTLACLQYTSGTSGTPKGVMLTHAAMLANSRQIAERFNSTEHSRGVIWLPPYHDMGLIGGVLQPMYVGFDVVLMPPAAFLQRPMRWIHAISRYKATISGGPCFAFGQTARSIGHDDLAGIDLSSWNVAFTGAERVRADTLFEFTAKFISTGFSPRAFLPCYGMAEATLMISGTKQGAGMALTNGHVSCGAPAEGIEIAIVDPDGYRRGEGRTGEIWVRGPALASGYWQQADATKETFAVSVQEEPGTFLRTGDLGFMRDGELFVTGRMKEMIILRGTNFYPQDIERTAEAAHAALQPDGAAAFSIDGQDGERLAIVHELRRTARKADPREIAAAIRTKVTTSHGIEVAVITLVGPGQVPRTVSGKIQRNACRELFLAGKIEAIATSDLHPPATQPLAAQLPQQTTDLPAYLAAKLAAAVGVQASDIDIHQPVAGYGIGSADAVSLAGQISQELNIDLPAMALWDYPTLAELAGYIAELRNTQAEAA